MRPFPWPRSRSPQSRFHQQEAKPDNAGCGSDVSKTGDTSALRKEFSTSVGSIPKPLQEYSGSISSGACDTAGFLVYMLPPEGATAGMVLQHSKLAMWTLFSKHEPMIFKIGYTHNPRWRWENRLYGYKFDNKSRWEKMVILFESVECCGPAMLEACLIDIFKCILSRQPFLCGNVQTRIYNLHQ